MFKKIIEKIYLKQKGNLAYYDILTGCFNRTYFEHIMLKKYSNQNINIILVDLNKLKIMNDTKGHIYRDKLIKFVEKEICPFGETARIGGDEFIIFCDDNSLESFKDKFQDTVLFSFGYINKNKDEKVKEAYNKVDKLMYKHKKKFSEEDRKNLEKIFEEIE